MFCRRCGKELLVGARFCTYCGAKQEPIVVSVSNAKPDIEKTMGVFQANAVPPAQPVYQGGGQPRPVQPTYQGGGQPRPVQPVYQGGAQPHPAQPVYQGGAPGTNENTEPDLEKTMGAFDANTIPPAQPQFGYGFCPDHSHNNKTSK